MTNKGNGAIMRELGISKQAYDFVRSAENSIKPVFERIDANAEVNLARVLAGFREENVGLRHFAPTTGYGYDDAGRDTLDRLFAHALFAEDALVRPQLTSGTHALYLALSGLCQMGDAVVAASGKPYDTLENAIGLSGDHPHSLKKQGVSFDYVDLNDDGSINIDGVLNMVAQKNAAVLYVQRSRGYAWRDSLLVNEHMAPLFRAVKERFPNIAIFVDNCYGEFTLSNGDTMKLWKVKDAYADLSALPMKGMAEEFPIEAEAEQIYVADVTSNGETTRQYLRTDKAGRNGTVSVKTFELGDAE